MDNSKRTKTADEKNFDLPTPGILRLNGTDVTAKSTPELSSVSAESVRPQKIKYWPFLIVALILVLIGGVVWLSLENSNGEPGTSQVTDENNDANNENDKNGVAEPEADDSEVLNIAADVENANNVTKNRPNSPNSAFKGRLYLLDGSDGVLHKQRYYLLVDDAAYGANADFLKRKTYVMDLASVGSPSFIQEVNLATTLTPFVESYIAEQRRENCETCSVEYFGYPNPMMIDFEKELLFLAFYHCTMYGGGETSLGSRLYAFDVEANKIRDMGAVN